jgi:hypothetical protein
MLLKLQKRTYFSTNKSLHKSYFQTTLSTILNISWHLSIFFCRELKVIMSLLNRFQLGITFNVHSIYRVSGNLSGEIPLGMIGSGVYQDLILLNHSCAPNTTRLTWFFRGISLASLILVTNHIVIFACNK